MKHEGHTSNETLGEIMKNADTTPVEEKGQIPRQVEQLTFSLNDLDTAVSALEKVLEPVLQALVPESAGLEKDGSELVPIASTIRTRKNTIDRMVQTITSILDRIEL